MQDVVRISLYCHQCKLPELLLLEKESSMLQQQTEPTIILWAGGRAMQDNIKTKLGRIIQKRAYLALKTFKTDQEFHS